MKGVKMKILVAYSSRTGNTKTLCAGVYEYLKSSYEVTILEVKNVKSVEEYDVVIPGF